MDRTKTRSHPGYPVVVALMWVCCGISFLPAQSFDPGGRRDPFIDLSIEPDTDPAPPTVDPGQLPPLGQRPPGLAGLAVSEITITGLAVGDESKVVLLRGIDNFTYLAREGNKLYDGRVSEISEEGVVFIQEIQDRLGNKETREVVRRLYTEED